MSYPTISVITVVLNDKNNIENTIKSVISQTYTDIEYIIIDGGSTDGTVEIINRYLERISTFITEPDKGLYDAMNKGTNLATGEWISYMNSGDQFNNKNVLHKIFVDNNDVISNKDVIYSDVITDFKTKRKIRKARNIDLFWRGLPFSHQAVLVKTKISKNRYFDLKYVTIADYDFLYAAFSQNAKFYYFNYPIAIVDATTGVSKNMKLKNHYKCFFEISKKYSSNIQIAFLFFYIPIEYLYAILRRCFLDFKKQ